MGGDLTGGLLVASTWVVPVLLAITLHEAMHGYVANYFGDPTAKEQGRITLNPFKHIDPFGTVLLPALLIMSGSPILFGWAKPVPVAFWRLNNPKRDMIWVAAAGPGVNILMAIAAAALMHTVDFVPGFAGQWWQYNLGNAILINIVLAAFNMLPIPPLDGGRVAVGLLPQPFSDALQRLERFGLLILIGLLFILPLLGQTLGMRLNVFAWVIVPVVNHLSKVILALTGHDISGG